MLTSSTTRHQHRRAIALALLVALAGCQSTNDGDGAGASSVESSVELRTDTIAEFQLDVPAGWVSEKPSNAMRLAQYRLGNGEDTTLTVLRFAGGAGSVEANIERWKGQFLASHDYERNDFEVGALRVSAIALSGTFTNRMAPNTPPREGWRMLAAIVVGNGDPLYVKLVGPNKTVAAEEEAFQAALESLRVAR